MVGEFVEHTTRADAQPIATLAPPTNWRGAKPNLCRPGSASWRRRAIAAGQTRGAFGIGAGLRQRIARQA